MLVSAATRRLVIARVVALVAIANPAEGRRIACVAYCTALLHAAQRAHNLSSTIHQHMCKFAAGGSRKGASAAMTSCCRSLAPAPCTRVYVPHPVAARSLLRRSCVCRAESEGEDRTVRRAIALRT